MEGGGLMQSAQNTLAGPQGDDLTRMTIADFPEPNAAVLVDALATNNLANLNDGERLSFLKALCQSTGMNMLTGPFAFHTIDGKLMVYATKNAGEQLRSQRRMNITISAREFAQDCYIVTARAVDGLGRQDESIGAVSIKGLSGKNLENALMKAETKAKRRVALSLGGLGMLDESEMETMREIAEETARSNIAGEGRGIAGLLVSGEEAETAGRPRLPAETEKPAVVVETAKEAAPVKQAVPSADAVAAAIGGGTTGAASARKRASSKPAVVEAATAGNEVVYEAQEEVSEEVAKPAMETVALSHGATAIPWFTQFSDGSFRNYRLPATVHERLGAAAGVVIGEFVGSIFNLCRECVDVMDPATKEAFGAACVANAEKRLLKVAAQSGGATFPDFIAWAQEGAYLPPSKLEDMTTNEVLRMPDAIGAFIATL